jgi:hypothetical protein
MGLEVQGLESMDSGTYTRIRTMIKNRQGLNGGLYVPNNAFHTLVSCFIEAPRVDVLKLLNPAPSITNKRRRLQLVVLPFIPFARFPGRQQAPRTATAV